MWVAEAGDGCYCDFEASLGQHGTTTRRHRTKPVEEAAAVRVGWVSPATQAAAAAAATASAATTVAPVATVCWG